MANEIAIKNAYMPCSLKVGNVFSCKLRLNENQTVHRMVEHKSEKNYNLVEPKL